MNKNELVRIETSSIVTNDGLDYMYLLIINNQSTPVISLDGLRRLRRLCDHFIALGEGIRKDFGTPVDGNRDEEKQ